MRKQGNKVGEKMDWSKAKSILIVAFIITNLLLGYVLLSSERQEETTIKDSFIVDVTKLLEKKDIEIKADIPKEIPSLNTLSVEYENIDPYEINNNFFQAKARIESKGSGITELILDDESILIRNKKTLLYQNTDPSENYGDLNPERAEELALNFLRERKYKLDDMKLSHINIDGQVYRLEFTKVYGDRYLETSSTIIDLDHNGIRSMERVWLNVLEEGERPRYINTAPKAMLSLLTMEEFHGKTITDISLSYYFNPQEQDYIDKTSEAKKGNTVPSWRLIFEDGTKAIIDNN